MFKYLKLKRKLAQSYMREEKLAIQLQEAVLVAESERELREFVERSSKALEAVLKGLRITRESDLEYLHRRDKEDKQWLDYHQHKEH